MNENEIKHTLENLTHQDELKLFVEKVVGIVDEKEYELIDYFLYSLIQRDEFTNLVEKVIKINNHYNAEYNRDNWQLKERVLSTLNRIEVTCALISVVIIAGFLYFLFK